MTINTYFSVYFICRGDADEIMEEIPNIFNAEADVERLFEISNDYIKINRFAVEQVGADTLPFPLSGNIIKFSILLEDIVHDEGDQILSDAISYTALIGTHIDIKYVFGMHLWRLENIASGKAPAPISAEGLSQNRIDSPTWLMVFPPEMVDTYGREWLLNLPAEHVEELDDGGVLVVATVDFRDCESPKEVAHQVGTAVKPIKDAFESIQI